MTELHEPIESPVVVQTCIWERLEKLGDGRRDRQVGNRGARVKLEFCIAHGLLDIILSFWRVPGENIKFC